MNQFILVFNTGSSSLKFSAFGVDKLSRVFSGEVENLTGKPKLWLKETGCEKSYLDVSLEPDLHQIIPELLKLFPHGLGSDRIVAAGHRVVHGGLTYPHSVLVTDQILEDLSKLNPMAPLHQPHNLEGIRILGKIYPNLPQVACFDTSFHHTQPQVATLFALPNHFWQEGIRRYGFHGLSYNFIAHTLHGLIGEAARGRVVVAHLGHGASLCALHDLKSVATTMGMTALDGLPMGTRCGSLDPGVVLYLASQGISHEEITHLLYNQSGLWGLSGVSDDFRELLHSDAPWAKIAIDYFCYRIIREIGSLVASLGGLDVLVFTGGIGEHVPQVRKQVCEGLTWIKIKIEDDLNTNLPSSQPVLLSPEDAPPAVWVIPTNEEIIIAKDVASFLADQ